MSDSELQDLLKSADDLIGQGELIDDLGGVDALLGELQKEEAAAPVAPLPVVRWKKRRSDGNLIHARPRSIRHQSTQGQYCYCFLYLQCIYIF